MSCSNRVVTSCSIVVSLSRLATRGRACSLFRGTSTARRRLRHGPARTDAGALEVELLAAVGTRHRLAVVALVDERNVAGATGAVAQLRGLLDFAARTAGIAHDEPSFP